MPAGPQGPVDVLRQHLEELWGEVRLELADALYAPDVVDHMPFPGQAPGVKGMLDVILSIRAGFPDLTFEVQGLHGLDNEFAMDRWVFRGTHLGEVLGIAATGRFVEFNGMDVVRVSQGRISEIWHVEELWQLHQQLTA